MRIRNRPAPSIFPPPPDLNLNRRSSLFPSSSPPPKHQVLHQDDDGATTTTAVNQPTRFRIADHDPSCDQTDATMTRRSLKIVTATTINSQHDDDNDADSNNTSSWKDENLQEEHSTGMQPFFQNKARLERKEEGAPIPTADAECIDQKLKDKWAIAGIVKKGEAVKRGSRAGAITTEGSRCSRVNGRGWRCGQQTLVGYSLCEHHLGKSRLRSLSSVKNVTTVNKDNFSVALNNTKKRQVFEDSDDDDEPLLISSRRKKSRIGAVKARSLSSLLSQTSQTTIELGVSQPSSIRKRNAGK